MAVSGGLLLFPVGIAGDAAFDQSAEARGGESLGPAMGQQMRITQDDTVVDHQLLKLPAVEAYSLWAETYDSTPNPFLALEERMLAPLLPDPKVSFVLDLACGTGRWLRTLLAQGARQGVGLDLSSQMLAQARCKQALHGRLVRADCTANPICSRIVDTAICSFAISYVANLGALASEISRVMKMEGHLIITDFHPSGSDRGWRRTFRHAERVVEILNFQRSIEQMCRAFQKHRFMLERIITPSFGEPERPIFVRRGKEHLFERAQAGPAIYICSFRLRGSYHMAYR